MKKSRAVTLAGLLVCAAAAAAFVFVAIPLLNDRANAILLTGSSKQIRAEIQAARALPEERWDYPVKWDAKTLIVSEATARDWTARGLILRKDPDNSDKRQPLGELPIRPADSEGLLFAAKPDEAQASAYPLGGTPTRLGYGGDYFLGNLRVTESAIVALPEKAYAALPLSESQLSLLKYGTFDDVSEKMAAFEQGARLIKIH